MPHPHGLSIGHFFESIVESFFHADGRLVSTAKALLLKPGELTSAYINGAHKKYIGPIQLFLIVNLVYFLIQSITGWNTFSTPLQIHIGDLVYRDLAKSILDHRLETLKMTLEEYMPIFNHSVRLHAKSLVIILIPLFSIPVMLLYCLRRPLVVPQMVFATHIVAFDLLLLTIIQPIANAVIWCIVKMGFHPTWQPVDEVLSLVIGTILAVYIFVAAYRVYKEKRWLTALKTLVMVLLLTNYVVLAFRFTLFLITLYAG
jgi:hypothetical protein